MSFKGFRKSLADLIRQREGRETEIPAYLIGIPLDVYLLFEEITLDLWEDKWPKYSARAILHRIRWHYRVEQGRREFKANNNWTPRMARYVMAKYPYLKGFFETRELKIRDNGEDQWDEHATDE